MFYNKQIEEKKQYLKLSVFYSKQIEENFSGHTFIGNYMKNSRKTEKGAIKKQRRKILKDFLILKEDNQWKWKMYKYLLAPWT